jgi:hypothetical protein
MLPKVKPYTLTGTVLCSSDGCNDIWVTLPQLRPVFNNMSLAPGVNLAPYVGVNLAPRAQG